MKKAIFICFITFAVYCSVYAADEPVAAAVPQDTVPQPTSNVASTTIKPGAPATKPLDSESGSITKPKNPNATPSQAEQSNSNKPKTDPPVDNATPTVNNTAQGSGTQSAVNETTQGGSTASTVKPTTALNNNQTNTNNSVTTPTVPDQSSKPSNVTDNGSKTPEQKPIEQPVQARGFDGASFVGGIILTLGLLAIGFMGYKYYKTQTERNYHTL